MGGEQKTEDKRDLERIPAKLDFPQIRLQLVQMRTELTDLEKRITSLPPILRKRELVHLHQLHAKEDRTLRSLAAYAISSASKPALAFLISYSGNSKAMEYLLRQNPENFDELIKLTKSPNHTQVTKLVAEFLELKTAEYLKSSDVETQANGFYLAAKIHEPATELEINTFAQLRKLNPKRFLSVAKTISHSHPDYYITLIPLSAELMDSSEGRMAAAYKIRINLVRGTITDSEIKFADEAVRIVSGRMRSLSELSMASPNERKDFVKKETAKYEDEKSTLYSLAGSIDIWANRAGNGINLLNTSFPDHLRFMASENLDEFMQAAINFQKTPQQKEALRERFIRSVHLKVRSSDETTRTNALLLLNYRSSTLIPHVYSVDEFREKVRLGLANRNLVLGAFWCAPCGLLDVFVKSDNLKNPTSPQVYFMEMDVEKKDDEVAKALKEANINFTREGNMIPIPFVLRADKSGNLVGKGIPGNFFSR